MLNIGAIIGRKVKDGLVLSCFSLCNNYFLTTLFYRDIIKEFAAKS